jgi:hypothetical protein
MLSVIDKSIHPVQQTQAALLVYIERVRMLRDKVIRACSARYPALAPDKLEQDLDRTC